MDFLDCHTHILPGIDDGSKSWDMTQQMLDDAQSCGIRTMIATPHFYGDRMQLQKFLEKRESVFDECFRMAEEKDILLLAGAEVAFFQGISGAEGIEQLCISGTNLMLVEMPFRKWESRDLQELVKLRRRGITPIIAHLERFYGYQGNEAMIQELLLLPVYIQLNAECFLHWRTKGRGFKLLKNTQVDFLGSDCHNITSRPENMKQCCTLIEKKFGRSMLENFEQHGFDIIKKHRREQ